MVDDDEQNPFTRPGFITAALVIAIIVVLGIVLALVNATRGDEPDPVTSPTPDQAATSTPTAAQPTGDANSRSICGLKGEKLDGTLTVAPETEWTFVGNVAAPNSGAHGPGAVHAEGFPYCFQRTPEGALFAAANAVALGASPENRAWLEYFTGLGPHRDALIGEGSGGESSDGSRLRIAGFRLLAYDGSTARVDIAGEGSTTSGSVTFSTIYELVWQDGDWRLSADTPTPFNFSTIPNLVGYVPWGS